MKVLVTGASGFVGSHLAETLIKKGYDVHCLIRGTSSMRWLKDAKVNFVYGDLRDADSLTGAVKDVDYIFHSAGLVKAVSRQGYMDANYIGTKNILSAVSRSANILKRFIHISSLSVTGPVGLNSPADETTFCRPVSDYGASKLAGENEAVRYMKELPITIIRPPVVYGPRDVAVYIFFQLARKGILPYIGGRKFYSLIYVKDLVDGIILSAESKVAEGRTYFIANDEHYSFQSLMSLIASALGVRGAVTFRIPDGVVCSVASAVEHAYRLFGRATFFNREKAMEIKARHWICSNELAKREIGFSPAISLADGLKETAEWYREMGWV
ncbi:MAG: hypothetical protein A2W23_01500 [Planctomycetes bacterium RBG_16_43_13]|nr:MAG: hypothetical protein A2W23_01500 [Planctomycetes bacterium RBG_16_43_13]